MSNELKVAKVQSILSLHAKGWTQQRIAETLDAATRQVRHSGGMGPFAGSLRPLGLLLVP